MGVAQKKEGTIESLELTEEGEKFISRGASVKEDKPKKAKNPAKKPEEIRCKKFLLSIPKSYVFRIKQLLVQHEHIKITQWINEAIIEKLRKEEIKEGNLT